VTTIERKRHSAGLMMVVMAATAVVLLGLAGADEAGPGSDPAAGEPDAAMTEVSIRVEKAGEPAIPLDSLSLVIAYDNYAYLEGLRCEWGFSCAVTCPRKNILFDTGGEGSVLLDNMRELSIRPEEIDIVVLSHIHGDHTGGLGEFLRANPEVTVYVLGSFGDTLKKKAETHAQRVIEVDEAMGICEGVYTTGEMGYGIKEQALILRTDRGLIVITGCAHPGIVEMVDKARSVAGGGVLLVLGGFHLARAGEEEIENVIAGLKDAGVEYAAPTHCTGDIAREIFRRKFGNERSRPRILTERHHHGLPRKSRPPPDHTRPPLAVQLSFRPHMC
jgi:7,8-dihydropterin-6-yl-methyl-4-(beta-D-ribofuranosyl)aminobenzene 5'-phosphate synthase